MGRPVKNKVTQVKIPQEIGAKVATKSIFDFDYCLFEEGKDLKFPYSVQTFDKMSKDSVIASGLNAVQIIALRVPRSVKPYDDSATHKKRAEFVDQCLGVTVDNNDMTHTFDDFLREAMSMNKYGFSIHEKVFRVRRHKNGSKYDDGKIGIKRLPIRPQKSLESFKYDDEGREIIGVIQRQSEQRFSALSQLAKKAKKGFDGNIEIPIENCLHFKADSVDGKGEGLSPLASIYDTWRDIQRYRDLEGIASSKNLNGLPVLKIPSAFMVDDPSDPYYELFTTLRDGVANVGIGQQSSFILPSDREDLTGQGGALFDLQLLNSSSSGITAITAIIQRLNKEMLSCLFATEVADGVNGDKTSLLNILVENRIKEIFTIINKDLIPHLFRLNGWDETKVPQLEYGKLRDIPFEAFAKAMQQLKATKLIPVTAENINYISAEMGLPYRVNLNISQDDLDELLGVDKEDESNSGLGYESGSGNGTAKDVSESDNSANNLDNK